jgi:hypothetical protein
MNKRSYHLVVAWSLLTAVLAIALGGFDATSFATPPLPHGSNPPPNYPGPTVPRVPHVLTRRKGLRLVPLRNARLAIHCQGHPVRRVANRREAAVRARTFRAARRS